MNVLKTIWRRLNSLGQRREVKREIDEELRFHIEQRTAESIANGMTPEEAQREARKRFGNVQTVREECRETRGASFAEDMLRDLRFAFRQLAKNPGFTAVAVLTLALGIGATTAIFSVVDGVLLKPLPYEQPGQLVQVWEASSPGKRNTVSPGAFLDWKEQSTIFESLSLLQNTDMNLTGEGEPERISGLGMSASGLQILGARPMLGRIFAPDEDQPGKDKVVVLTAEFWQRRFGGKTDVVGQTIQLAGRSYTVIGVLPRRFLPWEKAAFIVPSAVAPKDANERGADWLKVIGRLKQGVTVEQASAAMNALAARLRPLYPPEKKDWGVAIVPMSEQLTGDIKPTLLLLFGAVGFVLLIACANVANLLLAKASGRQREMALRVALGASRWRIVRQLLVESMLLSALGAAFGLVIAFWSIGAVTHLAASHLPRAEEVGLDLRVAGFALVVSLFAAFAFGLVPAIQASRAKLNDVLRGGTRATVTGPAMRLRSSLIVSEVAISLVLLVGMGLLLKSFVLLAKVAPGINPRNALTMQLSLPDQKYPDAEHRAAFFGQLLERIGNLPGVKAAGVIGNLPLTDGATSTSFSIIGRPDQPVEGIDADFDFCTPDYFRAIGTPLRAGRFFDQHDRVHSPQVVLINEAFAREYFPNEDPIGQRVHLDVFTRKIDEGWEIVGVVGDVHQRRLSIPPRPCVYRPQAFSIFGGSVNLVIRTFGAPLAMSEAVRKAVQDMDPSQPVANIRTLEDVIAVSFAERRFILFLLGAFAGAALLLTVIGIYGVIAYSVSQRLHEIGIRMALGANRGNVLALILRQGMKPVGLGIGVGIVVAFGLSRVLTAQLYSVKASDPTTFVLVSLLFLIVALLASLVPARRAAKVDPIVALRNE